MAIGDMGNRGDDGIMGVGKILVHQIPRDLTTDPLGRQNLSPMMQNALCVSIGSRNHLASHFHRVMGHFLGLEQHLNLVFILDAAGQYTKLTVVIQGQAPLLDVMCKDEGQRSVCHHSRYSFLNQAFRDGLSQCRISISAQPRFWTVIRCTPNSVSPRDLLGTPHFDVTNKQQGLFTSVSLLKSNECRRVSNQKANLVVKGCVGHRHAGHQSCNLSHLRFSISSSSSGRHLHPVGVVPDPGSEFDLWPPSLNRSPRRTEVTESYTVR